MTDNKISIEVDAIDNASKVLKGIGGNTEQAMKKASMSITDLRSSYQIAMDVVRVSGQVWAATGGEFNKYAENVKNLSRNIGVTAEDASRLIQVADDVRISFASIGTATKIAQKQGIDVSIEGLAKLADKYQSLAPGIQRTQFLLKTFGKSGLEMGKLMEKGGDGVRKMSGAIEDGLVLDEAAIKKSDDYKRALDQLQDTIHAVAVELGQSFTPAAQGAMSVILADIKAVETFGDVLSGNKSIDDWSTGIIDAMPAFTLFGVTIGKVKEDMPDLTGAIGDNTDAVIDNKDAVDAAGKAFDDYKKMLDSVSQANQDAESFIQSYADFSKGYAKDHAQAAAELSKAVASGNKEDIAQAQKGIQELEATWHEATQKMIYDMVLAKVSVDGLTDAEFKATQDVAVQMGIRTQAQADEAKAAMDKANSIVDGIALQEDVMREKAQTDANLLQLENDKKAAADGTTAAIVSGATVGTAALGGLDGAIRSNIENMNALGYAATTTGSIIMKMNMDSGGYKAPAPKKTQSYGGVGGVPPVTGLPQHALGGEFMIPMQYGNEGFNMGNMATASGGEKVTITPKGQTSGTVYNITIINPKREAAEDSIKSALRNLVYTGSAN